ncbi:poly(U)-specific 3'-to-5' RNA exonuclease [Rhizoclosmatium sp. JEL0117]|nr:poly(U)-specific 3'-to-5' RNA exonuclease [Rhizoclosmatium sp. JEL0117]
MNLVQYLDSDSNSDTDNESPATSQPLSKPNKTIQTKRKADESEAEVLGSKAKKRLPPPVLPESLQNKYKAKVEGRLSASAGKQIEFIPGNWSTIVYVSIIPSSELKKMIQMAMAHARKEYPKLMDINTMDDGGLHISLSRTVFLKEFQIPKFIDTLKSKLSERKRFLLQALVTDDSFNALISITLSFTGFNSYLNDDNSKTFLSMDVGAGAVELQKLTVEVDSTLRAFSQPTFYEDPKYHSSIGYFMNSEASNALNTSDTLRALFKNTDIKLSSFSFELNEVHCKTGNQLFRLPLSS